MRYADLPNSNNWVEWREAICDALSPLLSAEHYITSDIIFVTIKDWRVSRKWKIYIDDTAKNMKICYNKTQLGITDDFDVVCKIIQDHNDKLAARHDGIIMKRGKKDGDIIPFIMEVIRKKALDDMNVSVDSDTRMIIRYNPDNSPYITVYITFKPQEIELATSCAIGGVNLQFKLADPSFSPEAWAEWIVRNMQETVAYIQEADRKTKEIWA